MQKTHSTHLQSSSSVPGTVSRRSTLLRKQVCLSVPNKAAKRWPVRASCRRLLSHRRDSSTGWHGGCTCAIVMHSSASVTVSMGELITGTASSMLRDTLLVRLTCTQAADGLQAPTPPHRAIATWRIACSCEGTAQCMLSHLMCSEVDVPWMKYDIVVRVADTLPEELARPESCTDANSQSCS